MVIQLEASPRPLVQLALCPIPPTFTFGSRNSNTVATPCQAVFWPMRWPLPRRGRVCVQNSACSNPTRWCVSC